MDTIKTNQIEIGGKLLDIEPKKLNGNVQINLTGDVSGSIDTPIEAGKTITIETRVEGGTGGGIPEAPIDDKQYARKNAGWVEVEGGGADNTFVVTPGAIAAVTDTPTPFTDIKVAFQANKIIQAHAIVNGEGVYGYLQAFQFNSTTNKGSAIFAFYNSNPNYLNGTDFIITCSYDASASPTDTWEQSVQMPIPAPAASDANKVLKANSSGNAVGWDKVKSSELTNDAGFSKVVVGNAPPAAGTPDDTITLILGGAGGAGEYGAWEEIGSADIERSTAAGTQIPLSKSFDNFDFILFETLWVGPSNNVTYTQIQSVDNIKAHYSDAKPNRFAFNAGTLTLGSDNVNNLYCNSDSYSYTISVKVYGINLKGSKKVTPTDYNTVLTLWCDKVDENYVYVVPNYFRETGLFVDGKPHFEGLSCSNSTLGYKKFNIPINGKNFNTEVYTQQLSLNVGELNTGYTFSCWLRTPSSSGAACAPIVFYTQEELGYAVRPSSSGFRLYYNNNTKDISMSSIFGSSYYFYSVEIYNNTISLFVNGVRKDTTTVNLGSTPTLLIRTGYSGSIDYTFQDLTITKGRLSNGESSYTPPAYPSLKNE